MPTKKTDRFARAGGKNFEASLFDRRRRAKMIRENRKRAFFTMFVLAMLAATLTMAARQEKTAEKPAAAPKEPRAIVGAAEMERLKIYLGEWDYIETYPKSPFSPNGGKNTGAYNSQRRDRGQSIVNSLHA